MNLEDALFYIEFCQAYNIQKTTIKEIIKIPYADTGPFTEYRIMDDCETENRQYWI